jgi:hypothetical protein
LVNRRVRMHAGAIHQQREDHVIVKLRLRTASLLAAAALAVITPVLAIPMASAAVASPIPASSTPAAGCHTAATGSWAPNCTLREGDRSRLVQAVQLVIDGQEACTTDIAIPNGSFNKGTKKGVECFQRLFSLKVTGTVNRQTWRAMQQGLVYIETHKGWRYYWPNGIGGTSVEFRESVRTHVWDYGGPQVSSNWYRMDSAAPVPFRDL